MPQMPYRLRPGLSYCETNERLIFLDAFADRYFCLRPEAEAIVRRWSHGEFETDCASRHLAGNLLIPVFADVDIKPTSLIAATGSLLETEARSAPAWFKVAGAAATILATRRAFRRHGLAYVLDQLKACGPAVEINDDKRSYRLGDIAAAFERTKLFISPLDQCLRHSIALASSLARHDIAASLVIGVKLRPFLAHSWVQSGSILVNERLDIARTFTPILVG